MTSFEARGEESIECEDDTDIIYLMPPTLRMIRFSPSIASICCVFFVVAFAFLKSIHQSAVDDFLVPSGDIVSLLN